VIGSPQSPQVWSDAYRNEIESLCSELGSGRDFFTATSSWSAANGVLAITNALDEARGPLALSFVLTCEGGRECPEARDTLAALEVDRIWNVEEFRCNVESDPNLMCYNVSVRNRLNSRRYFRIRFEIDHLNNILAVDVSDQGYPVQ
jgi:hypothetical protein